MKPRDFWAMHPEEFIWMTEAQEQKAKMARRSGTGISEEEALEMSDELKQARVRAGFPAEG